MFAVYASVSSPAIYCMLSVIQGIEVLQGLHFHSSSKSLDWSHFRHTPQKRRVEWSQDGHSMTGFIKPIGIKRAVNSVY